MIAAQLKKEKNVAVLNCWEFVGCGREPGGEHVSELGVCPAAISDEFAGTNSGQNGGRYCWRVAGTMCKGEVTGSLALKLMKCITCEFYNAVETSEGESFKP